MSCWEIQKDTRCIHSLIGLKKNEKPVDCINQYLAAVYKEALERGYNFNKEKIGWDFKETILIVTKGQLSYEFEHLRNKLVKRDQKRLKKLEALTEPEPHPMFQKVDGEIEDWEVTQ